VLLPVYNAQHRLERSVGEILDVLPELSDQFELFIIDDGSTDETIDVAKQLAREYPQVSAVRHPLRLGLEEAVRTGLDHTVGDVVFVGDEHHGLDPEHLRSLWPMSHRQPAARMKAGPLSSKVRKVKNPQRQVVADIRIIRRDEPEKSAPSSKLAKLNGPQRGQSANSRTVDGTNDSTFPC
jgi:glycosyltransferase involved in cell wall biosynthesis